MILEMQKDKAMEQQAKYQLDSSEAMHRRGHEWAPWSMNQDQQTRTGNREGTRERETISGIGDYTAGRKREEGRGREGTDGSCF